MRREEKIWDKWLVGGSLGMTFEKRGRIEGISESTLIPSSSYYPSKSHFLLFSSSRPFSFLLLLLFQL